MTGSSGNTTVGTFSLHHRHCCQILLQESVCIEGGRGGGEEREGGRGGEGGREGGKGGGREGRGGSSLTRSFEDHSAPSLELTHATIV